jgi:ComF family protein
MSALQRLRLFGAQAMRLALDAGLPTLCVACRAPVAGEGVCATCWQRLSFIAPPYCPRLGIPFACDPGNGVMSEEALARPPAYRRARAAVRYDEAAKTLVHALKFQDRTDLAPVMGRWMARAGGQLLGEADLIVPVPLHWRRGLARRFNQAGALARGVAAVVRRPVAAGVLGRVRPTPHQIGLSRAERAANVQNAFRVPAGGGAVLAGRHVVLIDDVLTTGATAEACARVLTRAGAATVDVLVFARVVDTRNGPI